ncbi:hypothetical protein H0Z56_08250 [Rhizobium leguminosarum]|nr:hypothetical protein [Rhizobium leguminosarum]TAX27212.1 hypothetical protein ELI06_25155 [Rhizobium leguminosarum]
MLNLCRSHSVAARCARAGRKAARNGLRVYSVGRSRRPPRTVTRKRLSGLMRSTPLNSVQPLHIASIISNAIELPVFVDVARIEVFPTDQATGGGTMVKFPEQ